MSAPSPHLVRLGLTRQSGGLVPDERLAELTASYAKRRSASPMGMSGLTIDTSPHTRTEVKHSPIRVADARPKSPSALTMVDRDAARLQSQHSRHMRDSLRKTTGQTISAGVPLSMASTLSPSSSRSSLRGTAPMAGSPTHSDSSASLASTFMSTGSSVMFDSMAVPKASSPKAIGHMSGYAGHVPGYSYVHGRPFSRGTRRALNRDSFGHMRGEMVPSSPQAFSKIPNKRDTLKGHIPGYAGQVTGLKQQVGTSFTKATEATGTVDMSGKQGLFHKLGRKHMNAISAKATTTAL